MSQNKLYEEMNYLDGIAQGFGQKFDNRKSMMLVSGTVFGNNIMEVEFDDKRYYRFLIKCTRRKKTSCDIIPVMVPVTNENQSLKYVGEDTVLSMIGTFRSHDWNDDDGKHHLDVFFEAQHFEFSDDMIDERFDRNIVVLYGYICKEPEIKVSKKGITITEYRISVLNAEGKAEVFPIIAWGSKAVEIARNNKCGDNVRVLGRLQSRPYHKKTEGRDYIAYEVSSRYTRCYSKNGESKFIQKTKNEQPTQLVGGTR